VRTRARGVGLEWSGRVAHAAAIAWAACAVVPAPVAGLGPAGQVTRVARALALAFLAITAVEATDRARGARRALFGGILAAAGCALAECVAVAVSPGGPWSIILPGAAQVSLLVGVAAALGWRSRAAPADVALDALLLVVAAGVVGLALSVPLGTELLGAGRAGVGGVAGIWRGLPVALLILVGLLVASRSALLGRRTAWAAAAAGLAATLASELPRAARASPILWVAAVVGATLAMRGRPGAEDQVERLRTSTGGGSTKVRTQFIIASAAVVSFACLLLGVRGVPNPALAAGVAIFVALLAVRVSRSLAVQERQAQRLAQSIEAERTMTSTLERHARLMETERLAAVGELVAGVAHEVNNPLSSISAFAQLLLRDDTLNSEQRESVKVIRSETGRASQVVQDLLAFARRSEPQREPVDVNHLVERTVRLRNYQLTASNVQANLALRDDVPAVTGDARQLQQVVLNLVTNAIQAMAPMGGGTLAVSTRPDVGDVVLEIADTGPGILPEARARVFEPFFTTKQEGEGTGLGLSVSYGIVASHGGTITVTDGLKSAVHNGNSHGPGATFVVRLPASDAPATRSRHVSAEIPAITARSLLCGLRILFVDDEASLRQGFSAFGRLRGFSVVSAEDGRAALGLLDGTSVDAVVTDLRMPVMDGAALYEALRSDRPGLAARTVFITGDVIGLRRFTSGAAGARQPTLTKPFTFERLEETLVGVVRGRSVG
jgi:signal transduction histidine kinase/CheY-like chemotaxis protein